MSASKAKRKAAARSVNRLRQRRSGKSQQSAGAKSRVFSRHIFLDGHDVDVASVYNAQDYILEKIALFCRFFGDAGMTRFQYLVLANDGKGFTAGEVANLITFSSLLFDELEGLGSPYRELIVIYYLQKSDARDWQAGSACLKVLYAHDREMAKKRAKNVNSPYLSLFANS